MINNLIKSCKNLDRKAQREMVNYLSPFLFPTCKRYSNNHEDAKDILQESLILIFNNIEQCKSDEVHSFKSWCRRIAINTALAKKRKKKNFIENIIENENLRPSRPIIYSQLSVDEILRLLKLLPENQRNVFNLAVIDGYSHKEIASFLNIKESSSRTFLVRARLAMQQLIKKQEIVKK